jgi:uncharacterized protein YjbI with pentapeptide repeats
MDFRRSIIIAGFAMLSGFGLNGCVRNKNKSPSKRDKIMSTKISAKELVLLSGSNRSANNDQRSRLKITGKTFDADVRLDHFEWVGVDFESCDFINSSMYNGVLRDVRFMDCLFFANTWDDELWNDVSFQGCAWRGPFDMGASQGGGDLKFLDCEFSGATEEELGYGGKAETYGSIGGTNGRVNYNNCSFVRTYINGGSSTAYYGCKMRDVVVYGKDSSSIAFKELNAAGLVDVSNGKFSSVTVVDSEFHGRLTFNDTYVEVALFENIQVNLDLTLVKAKTIDVKGVTFIGADSPNSSLQHGLTCELAKIEQLTVIDCNFQGYGGRFHLSGEAPPRQIIEIADPKLLIAYSTDIGKLLIRNTPIDGGRFERMNIGQLELENLVLGDADFSHSSIQNFVTRSVRQNGRLKLEGTKIVSKDSELLLR